MKPGTPPLKSTRLLDQMRERIRYMHYSLGTGKVYLYWVRFFIRWHGRGGKCSIHATSGLLAVHNRDNDPTSQPKASAMRPTFRPELVTIPWTTPGLSLISCSTSGRYGVDRASSTTGRYGKPLGIPLRQPTTQPVNRLEALGSCGF